MAGFSIGAFLTRKMVSIYPLILLTGDTGMRGSCTKEVNSEQAALLFSPFPLSYFYLEVEQNQRMFPCAANHSADRSQQFITCTEGKLRLVGHVQLSR